MVREPSLLDFVKANYKVEVIHTFMKLLESKQFLGYLEAIVILF